MAMEQYKYVAFISHSHEDRNWAKKLHRNLENYRIPNIIRKEFGDGLRKSLKPVFLDSTDLGLGELKKNLFKELDDAHFQIVICSPNCAKSDWVNDEVEHFIKIGRGNNIIPFIVSGDQKTSYPPALNTNILGASIIELSYKRAVIKVIAYLLSLKFDNLWQRHVKRRRFLLIRNSVFSLLLLSVIVFLIQRSVISRNEKLAAEKRIVISKANDLVSKAASISTLNPNKAFLLLANAYYLYPDTAIFYKLNEIYEKNTRVYINLNNNRDTIVSLNLFNKTISGNYQYDISANDSTLPDYTVNDLLQFYLPEKTIVQLDHNVVNIINFETHNSKRLNLDSLNLNVLNWKYHPYMKSILFYCEDVKREWNDIYVYNLENNNFYNLYHNSFYDKDPLLGYYFNHSNAEPTGPDKILAKGYESYMKFYLLENTKHAIFYASHYAHGAENKTQRRFAIINLKAFDSAGVVNLTAPDAINGSYEMAELLSVSPGGYIFIVKYSLYGSYKDIKIVGYNLKNNASKILYKSDSDASEPGVISWIIFENKLCMLMGNNDGGVDFNIYPDNFSGHLYSEIVVGQLKSLIYNDKYIIGGTSAGYIFVWQNNIKNWMNNNSLVNEKQIASFKASDVSITDIQLSNDTLMFKDELNAIRICELNKYVALSWDPVKLKEQISRMNIDMFSKRDSITYAIPSQ